MPHRIYKVLSLFLIPNCGSLTSTIQPQAWRLWNLLRKSPGERGRTSDIRQEAHKVAMFRKPSEGMCPEQIPASCHHLLPLYHFYCISGVKQKIPGLPKWSIGYLVLNLLFEQVHHWQCSPYSAGYHSCLFSWKECAAALVVYNSLGFLYAERVINICMALKLCSDCVMKNFSFQNILLHFC